MFTSATRTKRTTHKPRKWSLRKRDERGLTTLEWLLIVAAVAGLAALAIVLVQGVVDDTAEDIRGSSARGQAALVAAQAVIDEARSVFIAGSFGSTNKFPTIADFTNYYDSKCRRLGITYSDADIVVYALFFHRAAALTVPTATSPPTAAPWTNTSGAIAAATQGATKPAALAADALCGVVLPS